MPRRNNPSEVVSLEATISSVCYAGAEIGRSAQELLGERSSWGRAIWLPNWLHKSHEGSQKFGKPYSVDGCAALVLLTSCEGTLLSETGKYRLANRRLQPLGHISAVVISITYQKAGRTEM